MNFRAKISLIIPHYRAVDCLRCLAGSLLRGSDPRSDLEICLYGDGGGPESEKALSEVAAALRAGSFAVQAKYNPVNLGNTSAVNAAVALATGEWLFLLNDDMVFPALWRTQVERHLKAHRVLSLVCVEPPVAGHRPSRHFDAADLGVVPERFDFSRIDAFQAAIAGRAPVPGVNYPFLVERAAWDAAGGVDTRFSGPYHDPDLFLRFRLRGLEMLRLRAVALYHFSGVSMRYGAARTAAPEAAPARKGKTRKWIDAELEARMRFIEKWGDKPRARFGEIPRTRVSETWNARERSPIEKARREALMAFERARAAFQRMRARGTD